MKKINEILIFQLTWYMDQWQKKREVPQELFLAFDDKEQVYFAVDNTTNDFWLEDFESEEEAIHWLKRYE